MKKSDDPKPRKSFSRRAFIKSAAGLGLTLGAHQFLAACGGPPAPVGGPTAAPAGEGDLPFPTGPVHLIHHVNVGPGLSVVPREMKNVFEREHPNVTVELLEGTNVAVYERMAAQAQVDPNNPYVNFGFFNAPTTARGDVDDMWVSLDPRRIPNLPDTVEEYRRPDNKGVPWGMSAVGLLHHTSVDPAPTSWLDLFDPRFRGKVALFDHPLFAGVLAVSKVLGGDEEDVDQAFDMYAQAARDGQFALLGSSNAQLQDALVSETALLEPFFVQFGITWGAKGVGGPVTYAIPEEGVMAQELYLQIVKGSTEDQIAAASEHINLFLSPAWISRHCNLAAQIPLSRFAQLETSLAIEPQFQPEVIDNAIRMDWATVARVSAELADRWNREVKANLA